jgi:hypothetical protein
MPPLNADPGQSESELLTRQFDSLSSQIRTAPDYDVYYLVNL